MNFDQKDCIFCHRELSKTVYNRRFCDYCSIITPNDISISKYQINYVGYSLRISRVIITIANYQIVYYLNNYTNHTNCKTKISKMLLKDASLAEIQEDIQFENILQFDFFVNFDFTNENKCLERIQTMLTFK